MAAFQFVTKNHNMVEYDYCGEGVFNVKVNGEEKEGTLYSRGGKFFIEFHKEKAVIYIPDVIAEMMKDKREMLD